jgi:hypothetical protein
MVDGKQVKTIVSKELVYSQQALYRMPTVNINLTESRLLPRGAWLQFNHETANVKIGEAAIIRIFHDRTMISEWVWVRHRFSWSAYRPGDSIQGGLMRICKLILENSLSEYVLQVQCRDARNHIYNRPKIQHNYGGW